MNTKPRNDGWTQNLSLWSSGPGCSVGLNENILYTTFEFRFGFPVDIPANKTNKHELKPQKAHYELPETTVTVTGRAVTWHLLLRHSLGRAQVLTKCNWVMGNCVYDADWSFSLRNCVWLSRWVKSKCRRKENILSYCCCCASSLQTEFVKVRCHLF